MKLAELKAKGAFVAAAPVKRAIVWKRKTAEGEEELQFDVYIKRHSFGTIEEIWSGEQSRSKAAAYIAASIRLGEKAEESFTYEDAYQLDSSLAGVLITAINEVNGTGAVKPKN